MQLKGFWCGTEACVELRSFWCGTEGVELRVFGVELRRLCRTEGFLVWN